MLSKQLKIERAKGIKVQKVEGVAKITRSIQKRRNMKMFSKKINDLKDGSLIMKEKQTR